jgi:predicted membrane-bound dolichyl-phosphate-mannose-protein mannosyltransferase
VASAYAQLRARPLVVLALVCLVSAAVRLAWLPAPCREPCRSDAQHVLVFDEVYYVNAARVIAGIRPPAGSNYAQAPLGFDPNGEHPQLAKLAIAGSIELLGDNPWGWRLPSVLVGTLALLGMFALVRAMGGGPWLAVGATALMASDNLLLVHSRIGTLDVFTLCAMLWGVALYLRGRWLAAGVVIGAGMCTKLVGFDALLVLVCLEALTLWRSRLELRARLRRLAGCVLAAGGVFIGLLALLDRIARPFDDANRHAISGGVFGHIHHMLSYASSLTNPPGGPQGIASYPLGWLVDYKPIPYLVVVPDHPSPDLRNVHPAVHFLGLISPPLLLAALPGLVVAALVVFRRVTRSDRTIPTLIVAWFAGTFLPFVVAGQLLSRTSYLYYMVVVMPALYLAAAWLAERLWLRRKLVVTWIVLVSVGAVVAYPLTPLPF